MAVGHPRPIDPDNFFGTCRRQWLNNRMAVPADALAFFDKKHFRPYARSLLMVIATAVNPRVKLVLTKAPGHYMFLDRDTNRALPDLLPHQELMPQCPIFRVEDVLAELSRHRSEVDEVELMTLLEEIRTDIPSERWESCVKLHTWAADLLR